MKTKKLPLKRLGETCLPDTIFVCFEPFESDIKKEEQDVLQNQSGRLLIKRMSDQYLGAEEIKIFTQKNEKPEVHCDGIEISVSFSHTDDGVSGAISKRFNVGCDIEHSDRQVHPRLIDRMRHHSESMALYEMVEPVRIWTLKESALKMIGTGLRKPMKSVRISSIENNHFGVQFDDGKEAEICSFQHNYHWISVCYQDLSFS